MKAKSRLAHNKNKKLIKVIGGTCYAHTSKTILRGYVGVNALILISILFFHVVGLRLSSEGTTELISPYVSTYISKVEAEEPPKPEFETDIHSYMYEVFGDEYENALKIATCESGLKPDRIGDQHIMGEYKGEMIGDSIGLFQIRTGDAGVYDSKPWSRAGNGTVEELRTKLKDYKYNIDYAKRLYDAKKSWSPWHNCMKKVL